MCRMYCTCGTIHIFIACVHVCVCMCVCVCVCADCPGAADQPPEDGSAGTGVEGGCLCSRHLPGEAGEEGGREGERGGVIIV